MAQIHIKENTTAEMSVIEEKGAPPAECESCTKVGKDTEDLVREKDCAGEWTRAIGYINAPAYQNMLVIPSATSLQDAVNEARRCGGNGAVTFYTPAVIACAPYIRCNL